MPPINPHATRVRRAALLLAAVCLAVTGGVVRAGDGPGDPPPAEGGYIGAQACKVCHNTEAKERRWDTWMNTAHADALETLRSAASAQIARDRGLKLPAHEAPECLRCHVTAYDTAQARALARIRPLDGVQCETCHGAGAEHQRDVQRAWIEKATGIDVSARIDFPDRDNCVQCHNPESPTWNPKRYTLPDGSTSGFDYTQAKRRSIHPEVDMRPSAATPSAAPLEIKTP